MATYLDYAALSAIVYNDIKKPVKSKLGSGFQVDKLQRDWYCSTWHANHASISPAVFTT